MSDDDGDDATHAQTPLPDKIDTLTMVVVVLGGHQAEDWDGLRTTISECIIIITIS